MPFLSSEQLQKMGFYRLGRAVLISEKASIYNPRRISIGDHSRIDDFCILSAGDDGIEIGRNVHVACMTTLIGKQKISIGDFANLSSRVAVYSSSDDFSGEWMTNPTIPREFTNVKSAAVAIGRHAIVGCGSVLLPGSVLGDGAAIGALSLVRSTCDPFMIYAGSPVRPIRPRSRKLLDVERAFIASEPSE